MDEKHDIDGLSINPVYITTLKNNSIHFIEDLYHYEPLVIQLMLDAPPYIVTDIYAQCALILIPPFFSAVDLMDMQEISVIYIPILFSNTLGVSGYPLPKSFKLQNRVINEIIGTDDRSKSDLCMSACISTVLPTEFGGLNASVIYIQTKSTMFSRELAFEMLQYVIRLEANSRQIHLDDISLKELIELCYNRIHVIDILRVEDVFKYLSTFESKWIERNIQIEELDITSYPYTSLQIATNSDVIEPENIKIYHVPVDCKLLVIDGMSSWVDTVMSEAERRAVKRHELLSSLSSILKTISNNLNIAVCATSSVSISEGDVNIENSFGVSWTHAVTNRWFIDVQGVDGVCALVKSATEKLGSVIIKRSRHGYIVNPSDILLYINS